MIKNTPGDALDSGQEILHPASRAIFRYWESIRGERSAPARGEIDLKALKAHVPSLFIMERHPVRQHFTWRLAGTRICELWRQELTGRSVFAGWNSFEQETVGRLFTGVVFSLQPCCVRQRLLTAQGHSIGTEIIALPVQARGGARVHIFGALSTFTDDTPRGYDSIASVVISSARVIWTVPVPGDRLVRAVAQRVNPALSVIIGGRDGR